MTDIIIERTSKFRLVSHGNRAAFTMENLATGESKYVQYGDDAFAFDNEYVAMQAAFVNPKSIYHNKPWDDCLAYLYEVAGPDKDEPYQSAVAYNL